MHPHCTYLTDLLISMQLTPRSFAACRADSMALSLRIERVITASNVAEKAIKTTIKARIACHKGDGARRDDAT